MRLLDTAVKSHDPPPQLLTDQNPAPPASGRSPWLPYLKGELGWPLAVAASAVLHYTGLLRLYERVMRARSGPRAFILLYHRVSDGDPCCRNMSISPRLFRKQIAYLAHSRYRPISLTTLLDYLEGRTELTEDSIAVTFDDGYRDNFTMAYPILQEFQVPATIFLTTGLIDSQEAPWWDRVGRAIARLGRNCTPVQCPDPRIPAATWRQVRAAARVSRRRELVRATEIVESLKSFGGCQREQIVAALEGLVVAESDMPLMLTWEMIRQMRGELISFGSHTVTHPVLSRINAAEARRELSDSKRRIESMLGEEVPFFAYPNGAATDFSPQTIDLVREAGFKLALTTVSGTNDRHVNPRALKRYGAPNVPAYALATRLPLLR
jgi:peptidoglycan/xylan/chitin deacetylase (PgdA/CDA1 family)